MKAPPQSIKHSLASRLNDHARTRWPELAAVDVRFRTNFAYVDGRYPDGMTVKLCRLRWGGVLHTWSFAIYLATTTTKVPSRISQSDQREPYAAVATSDSPPETEGVAARVRARPLPTS
jgi:hypothetical protein